MMVATETDPAGSGLLFTPLEVAGLKLPNRLVMPPMGTGLPDHDGHVTDETIAYYRRRAQGGVGLISVEASLVSPDAYGVGPEIRLHDEAAIPGLTRLAEAIQQEGVPVGVQLWHPGRQTLLGKPIAPSPVPLSPRTPIPHALTIPEIHKLIEFYALSAAHCQAAGYDFVEVHGAHCYLPCEFLSPLSNHREDEYGGSLENRARFMLDIVRAIRASCGEGFPIFFRISGEEGAEGGFGLADTTQVSRWLQDAGVGCISVSGGNWYALHLTIPPMSVPRGALLPSAAAIRATVDVPVIAAGRLDDVELAERALADGSADLIAIGRALLADADWPRKVRENRRETIRPCISCNACVDLVAQAKEARCAVNPEVGRDGTWHIEPTAAPRRVMVVGSGPSGMEAARIARLRGHEVSLWERDAVLGGKLDVASRAPSKTTVLDFAHYQRRTLGELGVDIHTGVEVTPDQVTDEAPDVVIVATGAAPLVPPIHGLDSPVVIDAQRILLNQVRVGPGERVAVIGGSATGCETAEFLIETAGQITILEMLGSVGRGIEIITRQRLIKDLRAKGVQILTGSRVTSVDADRVHYDDCDGTARAIEVDRVALAIGWRPRGSRLAEALQDREVHVIGDALTSADFVAAINAGANAGLAV
jgi:2,4-dienoyl-CoA reductase-like NADH-dependent reductase (Old Yellow Enzyme family)/thioredoxin reductase